MRAVGYFRESSLRDLSLAQQHKLFLEYCERQGYEVAGTFVDEASSNGHAPGFRQLVTYVRAQEPGLVTVIVPSVATLGADLRDAARRYFQLEGLGARVTAIHGSADGASDIVSAWGALGAGSRLSDRVRAAMRKKAVKGEVLGRPPYGYRVGPRRRLEVVPEEAVVVRYIYRLYLRENMGIRLIARRLNEEALKTRRGGNWSMVSIRDILRNRAYLGTYSRFGVKVPGSHKELVSTDDFKRVQERLTARRTPQAPRTASQFLLSGLAVCGQCGNNLIGVSRKQSWTRKSGERITNAYRYYQCESRTNQSVCGYHTRRADDLEAQVRAQLLAMLRAPDGDHRGRGTGAPVDREAERGRLRSRLRNIDRRLEAYVGAAASGRMPSGKLRALSVSAASDRLAVEDALEAAERRMSEAASRSSAAAQPQDSHRLLLASWEELSFAERQDDLRELVAKVIIGDGDDVTVVLRA
ncbi:MAG: recombinase family protein [Chloroflexi bacterium]|nr:recombinase family protein [Chloroflexota bacterium]